MSGALPVVSASESRDLLAVAQQAAAANPGAASGGVGLTPGPERPVVQAQLREGETISVEA